MRRISTTSLLLTTAAVAAAEKYCRGSNGEPYGSSACATVTWKKDSAAVSLYVKDTRTNGDDAYGWYRIYWADGSRKDSEELWDRQGNGVTQNTYTYHKSGIDVTGIRVYACQDDFGADTCDNGFWGNPK